MTTEKLYEFLVLSQTLNYSQAAAKLYISQSVLSKHIKELERELGTGLFNRTTHGVTLTPAGKILTEEAKGLIDSCNHALNLIQLKDVPVSGSIRLAFVVEFSYASHLQVFMQKFMEHYPEIELNIDILTEGAGPEILEQYDIVLSPCEHQILPENTEVSLISTHGTYAVIYPEHRLLSKSLLSLSDFYGETLVLPFSDELFGPYARNYQLIKKYTRDKISCIPVSNLASALFMVAARRGIAVVPRYVRHMLPGNLFMVGISNKECSFNEYLYYRNTGNGSADLFVKEYKNTFLR